MTPRAYVSVAGAALLAVLAAASPAAAFTRPLLDFAVGTTLGPDSRPDGGGVSGALTATWPVLDAGRFGLQLFADDIGTTVDQLADPNDGVPLGSVAERHRWVWGGAWHAETRPWRWKRWSAAAAGGIGWSRTEDDMRGSVVATASSVGTAIGLDVRHTAGNAHELGFSLRFKKLYKGEHPGFDRVGHYGTAAITLRWAAARRS